ncbi:sensor histidine kinase [Oryzobacter telluris]|uniref:sensor histidine kinase n=1 Tax=Oryzobacter telluris TaxID=3149179 RepID=UPI00370D4910
MSDRLPPDPGRPRPRSANAEGRLRRYLLVNGVAIWVSVLILVVLRVAVVGKSSTIEWTIEVLAGAGVVVLAAVALASRARSTLAAFMVVVATWGVALAITWFTPFIAPVGLLALLLPLVIVADHLPRRGRAAIVVTTTLLSGTIVAVGSLRGDEYDRAYAYSPLQALMLALFVPLLVSVLVLGLRDYVSRLQERTRELEESRSRLAQASVEARRGIERDLHDGAQQRLATLAVDIGRATRLWEKDPAAAGEVVRGLQGQLELAIRELRDLAHGIYPTALGEKGLPGALPAAARRTVLPCTVDARDIGRHTPAVEAAVYFCCLEAIQNADRHSHGTLISVLVDESRDGGGLRFRVTDDGTGFEPDAVPDAHGLTGMRDRIRAAGGELRIESARGRGTTVEGQFAPGTRQPR